MKIGLENTDRGNWKISGYSRILNACKLRTYVLECFVKSFLQFSMSSLIFSSGSSQITSVLFFKRFRIFKWSIIFYPFLLLLL